MKRISEIFDEYWVERKPVNEVVFEHIYREIVTNDKDVGGKLGIVVGEPGCGKTTFLLNYLEEQYKARSVCIWRGRDMDHICRIPDFVDKVCFYVYEPELESTRFFLLKSGTTNYIAKKYDKMVINNVEEGDVTDQLRIKSYSSIADLNPNAFNDRFINVIYEPKVELREDLVSFDSFPNTVRSFLESRHVGKLIKYESRLIWYLILVELILKKKNLDFHTVIFDEVDDIFPSLPPGHLWHVLNWFKDLIKDARKAYVNFLCSVHSFGDVEFKILSKMNYFAVMSGLHSKRILSRIVNTRFIDIRYLQRGELWLFYRNLCGKGMTRKYERQTVLQRLVENV